MLVHFALCIFRFVSRLHPYSGTVNYQYLNFFFVIHENYVKIIFIKNHIKCNTIRIVQVTFIVFDKNVGIKQTDNKIPSIKCYYNLHVWQLRFYTTSIILVLLKCYRSIIIF